MPEIEEMDIALANHCHDTGVLFTVFAGTGEMRELESRLDR
jgi:hypothetical protein